MVEDGVGSYSFGNDFDRNVVICNQVNDLQIILMIKLAQQRKNLLLTLLKQIQNLL